MTAIDASTPAPPVTPLAECPRWCVTAVLTPVRDNRSPDDKRLYDHCRWVLDGGCNGVTVFGTTGEGMSFSREERCAALEQLIARGIDPGQIVVGTGAASMREAILITAHAAWLGCTCLVMPPFFFPEPPADGIADFYRRLIDAIGDLNPRILAYHIPSVSGVDMEASLLADLVAEFPGTIVGVKDSSCDWAQTSRFLQALPDQIVLVGNEPDLPAALANGGRGTICGLANVAPGMMARLVLEGDETQPAEVDRLVAAIGDAPFVPTLKAALATIRDDEAWRHVVPPLAPASADDGAAVALVQALAALP